MKVQIPKASCFDYSSLISQDDIENAICIIDKLINNGRHREDKPTFQTIDNLFLFDEFNKFQSTFIDACQKLLNIFDIKYLTHAFSYMDYYDNFILKNRDTQWHNHKEADLVGIMYLKNDEYLFNNKSGTEFATDTLTSIGFIDPIPFAWHIFPGHINHRPGIILTNNKRYILNGSIKFL